MMNRRSFLSWAAFGLLALMPAPLMRLFWPIEDQIEWEYHTFGHTLWRDVEVTRTLCLRREGRLNGIYRATGLRGPIVFVDMLHCNAYLPKAEIWGDSVKIFGMEVRS